MDIYIYHRPSSVQELLSELIIEIKKEMIIFVTYSQAAQRVQSLFLISKTLTSMAFKDPTMMLAKTTGPMILRGVS